MSIQPGCVTDEVLECHYDVEPTGYGPFYRLKAEFARSHPHLPVQFYGFQRDLQKQSLTTSLSSAVQPSAAATTEAPPAERWDKPVTVIRLTTHTIGAVSPASPPPRLSQNHWKIFLLTKSGGSASFSMDVQQGTDVGLLTIKDRPYETTDSVVRSWDLQPRYSFTPHMFNDLIKGKGRARYRMTDSGVGCRYWVRVVMGDLLEAGAITQNAMDEIKWIFDYNFSIGFNPVKLEMKQGTFF